MITHAFKNNYDVAILVAGDNDYVGAIQAVKDNGKHVEVALFGQERTSRQLRDVADRVITLDGRILRGCWKGPPPPGVNPPRPPIRGVARVEHRPTSHPVAPRTETHNVPQENTRPEPGIEPRTTSWNDSRFDA
jgi:hypothetical protein